MNILLVTNQKEWGFQNTEYLIGLREIILVEDFPLTGRTIIMKVETGFVIMT